MKSLNIILSGIGKENISMPELMDWKNSVHGRKFIASFSGGKDSVLALYKAMKIGEAIGLIVMLEEKGERSRSHYMLPELIHAQARSIGLPLFTAAASWEAYEREFMHLL